MTYIYVMPLHEEYNGYGVLENGGLPPSQPTENSPPNASQEPPKPGNVCSRFFTSCRQKMSCKKQAKEAEKKVDEEQKTGCFNCRRKKPDVTINIEPDETKLTFWERIKCCGKNKVGDTGGCFPSRRKDSWTQKRDNSMSETEKSGCRNFFRRMFCLNRCQKPKKQSLEEIPVSRRASTISKKKSLTPSVPPEDNTPKLDTSLVDHNSHMKAAIPVLPIPLAWFCLVMNCIAPGTGTVFSGLFCLCLGIPRFSQKDGAKQRIGAFIINLIIGFSQFFTVLFCLVGWGWSIWWGIIMLKVSRKHKKIKTIEAEAKKEEQGSRQRIDQNHDRDLERAS